MNEGPKMQNSNVWFGSSCAPLQSTVLMTLMRPNGSTGTKHSSTSARAYRPPAPLVSKIILPPPIAMGGWKVWLSPLPSALVVPDAIGPVALVMVYGTPATIGSPVLVSVNFTWPVWLSHVPWTTR